jgi:hypothetical protein
MDMANADISDFLVLDKSRDGPARPAGIFSALRVVLSNRSPGNAFHSIEPAGHRPDTVGGSVRDPLLLQTLQTSVALEESGAVEFYAGPERPQGTRP